MLGFFSSVASGVKGKHIAFACSSSVNNNSTVLATKVVKSVKGSQLPSYYRPSPLTIQSNSPRRQSHQTRHSLFRRHKGLRAHILRRPQKCWHLRALHRCTFRQQTPDDHGCAHYRCSCSCVCIGLDSGAQVVGLWHAGSGC